MLNTPRYFAAGNLNATESVKYITDESGELNLTDGTLVCNISSLSGKLTEMLIGISISEFVTAFRAWDAGELIQNAFPTLSADEREFVKTGITPQEWDAMFGED